MAQTFSFLPAPRRMSYTDGTFTLPDRRLILLDGDAGAAGWAAEPAGGGRAFSKGAGWAAPGLGTDGQHGRAGRAGRADAARGAGPHPGAPGLPAARHPGWDPDRRARPGRRVLRRLHPGPADRAGRAGSALPGSAGLAGHPRARRDARYQPRQGLPHGLPVRAGRPAGGLEDQPAPALHRAHLRLPQPPGGVGSTPRP